MKLILSYCLAIFCIALTSCSSDSNVISDWDTYMSEHEEWEKNRISRLRSENGWLNLAGLFWLRQGENTFGSDPSNSIVFPEKFPAYGGSIILEDSIARLNSNPEAGITIDDDPVGSVILRNDHQDSTSIMETGSFRWFVIKRGSQYGIRLRNLEHPRIKELKNIPSYPFNKKWVVEATFTPYDSLKTLQVPTVIPGFYEYYKVPGELTFSIKDKEQTLLPFASRSGYFLIVGDATNGLETYGAGRFLYTDMVDGDHVILDFNKAYNPPCAFSPFATCPLPPPENILDIEIEAGEKAVHFE
ncbi:MAG: DUF1684 domain-containing protein [Bacteroidales bacterium]|nr:DUF1684 domain-containing protein [Bacteroidales bacterium]